MNKLALPLLVFLFALISGPVVSASPGPVVAEDPALDAAIKFVKKNHEGRVLSARRQADGTILVKLLTKGGVIKHVVVDLSNG